MMLYATKDDPASQKVLDFKLWGAIILVGGMMIVFFMGQLNLMLGLERESPAVVEKREVRVGAKSNHYTITFKTKDGKRYKSVINSFTSKRIKLGEKQEVTIKTDGLLWRKVVEVDSGDGFKPLL